MRFVNQSKENNMKCLGALILIFTIGCSAGNLDYVKNRAEQTWRDRGYQVVGYNGYLWRVGGVGTSYGGAFVCYELKSIPDNGLHYEGCLQRWGNELHVYAVKARDAIRPN